MSTLRGYAEYGNESVQLLGCLPSGWSAIPVKVFGNLSGGAGFPHEEQGREGEEIEFHKVNALGAADEHDFLIQSENTISVGTARRLRARVFPARTIVFAKVGAALLLSRFRWLRRPACIDNNMMGLEVAPGHSPAFVKYAIGTLPMRYVVNPGAVPSVNEGGVGNLRLPGPPLEEQTQIAKFLDYETARIDALIDKQQQLIELLKEKRQAVISHAVTKGLDPKAPMRDSGVEWLDQVPAHWEVSQLGHLTHEVTVGIVITPASYYVDAGIPCLRSLNVRPGHLRNESLVHISPTSNELLRKSKIYEGDVVVVRTGQPGTAAMVTQLFDGCNCIDLIIVRRSAALLPAFLVYLMNSEFAAVQVSAGSGGAIQQHFNVGIAKKLKILAPPISEQRQVVEFLDAQTAKLDRLVAKAETTVDLLQERRTALISAAVTGKIDVRNWKAPEAHQEVA